MEHELRGEGPTAVLVHGLTVDRRVMIEAFDELLAAAGVRRLYVDLPGHGASTGDAAHASADDFVDELAALVRGRARRRRARASSRRRWSSATRTAATWRRALVRELGGARGLMLVCPVVEPDFARRTQPTRRIAVHDPELVYSADPREREAFAEVAVQMTRPVLERFQRVVHPANIAADAAVVAAVRARYALSRPIGDALSRLDAPSTIVCGRDDHWAGWQDAVPLVAQLARPHFVVLPDCGHLLPFEQPLAFAQAVRDFLARCL